MKNNMGDGWSVSKDEKGRTLYTSECGRFLVRRTAQAWPAATWVVESDGSALYALSLRDAAGVVDRIRRQMSAV